MNSRLNHPRRGADQNNTAAESEDTAPWLRRLILSGKVLAAVVAVLFIAVVALFLITPRMASHKYRAEEAEVSGLSQLLRSLVPPSEAVRDAKGRELFQAAIHEGHWKWNSYLSLLSYNEPKGALAEAEGNKPVQIRPENCSYTAPYGRDIAKLARRKGADRRVVITFNVRNWNNYPDRGVIVDWGDGERASWMTFEQAERDWGITEAEWADPAGKLFGKKAPFEYTYE